MKRNKFDMIMEAVDTIVKALVVLVLVLIIGSICISEYNYMSTISNGNFNETIEESAD